MAFEIISQLTRYI